MLYNTVVHVTRPIKDQKFDNTDSQTFSISTFSYISACMVKNFFQYKILYSKTSMSAHLSELDDKHSLLVQVL